MTLGERLDAIRQTPTNTNMVNPLLHWQILYEDVAALETAEI